MRKKIRFVSLALLAFALIFGAAHAFAFDDYYVIDPETGEIIGKTTSTPTPQNPNVKLINPVVIRQASGTEEQHEISLRNIGYGMANNLLVTATISGDAPFTVSFLDNTQSIRNFSSSSTRSVLMEINVDDDAASGSYTIDLTYSYMDNKNDPKTGSDKITVRIDGVEKTVPSLILTDFSISNKSIVQDTRFSLSAQIKNTGKAEAKNVQLVAGGFEPDKINIADSSNQIFVADMSPNATQTFKLEMYTLSKTKPGSYPVNFTITYKDVDGNDYTYENQYYINVYGVDPDDSKAALKIVKIEGPDREMGVGENFDQVLTVLNSGSKAAQNVKITSVTDSENIVPKSSSVQQIFRLEPGGSEELVFTFAPTSNAKSQNYNIAFNVEYETGFINDDDTIEIASFEQYSGVNVTNPEEEEEEEEDEEEKVIVPKIIIGRYSTNPMIVQAGREFDLNMTFLNSSTEKTIQNIEISLTVQDKTEDKGIVFSPVDSSNSFYIQKIGPGMEFNKSLRLYTVPDAAPRNYQIQVNFEYDDADGNSYTSTKIIGINVKQIAKLDTSEIYIPEFANIGEPVYVSFNLYNKGKVKLNNMLVRVEGDFETSNAEFFYGTFDIGFTEWYDGSFMPKSPGQQEGKLIISYEDDLGDEVEFVKDFSIMVAEPILDDMMLQNGLDLSEMPMEQPSGIAGLLTNKYIWVGGGIVAAGAAAAILTALRIRKRKAWESNE